MADDYWTRERDYGGILPQSLNGMKESAHKVLANTQTSSRTEHGMARAILYLLGELQEQREEARPWCPCGPSGPHRDGCPVPLTWPGEDQR